MATSSHYWFIKTMSMIPKSLEMAFSEVNFWFGWTALIHSNLYLTVQWIGIQIHLYLIQLHWKENQGNKIRQCSYTWYNSHYHSFPSLYSNIGGFSSDSILFFYCWSPNSSTLHCYPPSFAKLTLWLILNDFTVVF